MSKFVILVDGLDMARGGNSKSFYAHQIGDELSDIKLRNVS